MDKEVKKINEFITLNKWFPSKIHTTFCLQINKEK